MRDSIKFTRFYNDTAFIKLHLVTQFNGFHIRVINILVQVICMSCKKALLVISDKVTTKDIANDGIVSYNFQSTNLANAVRRAFQSLCQKKNIMRTRLATIIFNHTEWQPFPLVPKVYDTSTAVVFTSLICFSTLNLIDYETECIGPCPSKKGFFNPMM